MTIRGFEITAASYDLVVVGGGLAGVCAAIAAARHGLATALVHDRPVLGGNSSSEVRVNPRGAGMMNAWARETGIIEEIVLEERARNHEVMRIGAINSVWDQVLYEWVTREPRLALYLDTLVDAVEVEAGAITAVYASQRGSERRLRLIGHYFVDATGDGTVGALAGADFRMGREGREEYGETLSPPAADAGTQGSTLLFRARMLDDPVPFTPPSWAAQYDSLPPHIEQRVARFFAEQTYGGFLWIEIGVPYDTIRENEEIRRQLLRHVYGIWDYLKNSGRYPADNLALDWVGSVVGKRESRRLLGDHVLTQREVWDNAAFPDRVATGGWWLDVHTIGGILAKGPVQKMQCGVDEDVTVRPFSIPLRALYSRNVPNLFMAGRDISVTHAALGSVRVMLTGAMLGQAVGTAAALAHRYRLTPRELSEQRLPELQQLLVKDDAFLLDMPNADPQDLAHSAYAAATSTAAFDLPPLESSIPLEVERAQIFPLSAGHIDLLAVLVESTLLEETTLEIALERVRDLWDFRVPGPAAARLRATAPAGHHGWVAFPCELDIPAPGLYQLSFPVLPGISLRRAISVPGVSAAWRYPRWTQRWQGAKDDPIAMRLQPPSSPYEAASVINGTARPEQWPNLWISDPAQPLPQALTLTWASPVTFDSVYLTFDTYLNEDAPELPPRWRTLQCARDYTLSALQDGEWRELATITGNYQRRRIHRFAPVSAGGLRVTISATNGDPSARIYEVRVYREQ